MKKFFLGFGFGAGRCLLDCVKARANRLLERNQRRSDVVVFGVHGALEDAVNARIGADSKVRNAEAAIFGRAKGIGIAYNIPGLDKSPETALERGVVRKEGGHLVVEEERRGGILRLGHNFNLFEIIVQFFSVFLVEYGRRSRNAKYRSCRRKLSKRIWTRQGIGSW